jgi:hypothetical protein
MCRIARNTEFFPAGLAPITEDGSGNHVCLDGRPRGLCPIVYWSQGGVEGYDDITHLCDRFQDFLALLRVSDDADGEEVGG